MWTPIYRAILFDFDNTLINYTQCEQEALRHTVLTHGIVQDEAAEWTRFQQIFNPINWSYWENRQQYTRNELTLYTFRDTLQHYVGDIHAAELLSETYWDKFCNSCYFEPGAHEALRHISASYQVGLITNGYGESQRKRLRACGIEQYFDALVISDEVGIRKPNPRIFEIALQQLQVGREEVLFVGDSITDDYYGARNAGISFCHYNRDHSAISDDIKPLFQIKLLSELQELL